MLSGLFSRRNINQGVAAWAATAGAVLLDVRTEEEYATGHIDGQSEYTASFHGCH